ncbi:MAG: TylF/MycF family methyltransferase [Candidatus Kerfeldbacteria bacterium]|nr:TylF/MycF family methyltransferase [Candidatus Kerfeldbacteria bacterium]
MKTYRYSPLTRILKEIYRAWNPVPRSPWTAGEVADMCAVNLVPPETLVEFFTACVKRLRQLKGDNIGDYLEFGVFNGNSIGSMALVRKQMQLESMRLFGFDAFEGLPAGSENEDDGVWKKGFYACSFEQLQECLRRRGVDTNDITWVKGWYTETLNPHTAEQHALNNFGIVFIDCDTYSSSKAVLDFLASRITRPLIICLDDWKLNDLDIKGMGEYKSFNEFLENNPRFHAQEIPSYNRKSKSFLITL